MDKELWERIRKQLDSSLPTKKKVWFKKAFLLSISDDEIKLGVNSKFCLQGLERNGIEEIVNTASELAGHPVKITLQVADMPEPEKIESKKDVITDQPGEAPSKVPSSRKKAEIKKDEAKEFDIPVKEKKIDYETGLNPIYNFDNFVVGENNNFAYNAAKVISRNPGISYNPCLIYGGVGLGKTHLLQAIGNYIVRDNPKMKVAYITAETFTNELINSIVKKNASTTFKMRYRNVDVLLIDDIHFLQGKDASQEELFHTFNALTDKNKQIVFTCDRPISELRGIEDRIRTRFTKGLNVDLQPPMYEMRMAIVKRKCEELGYNIPTEYQELICQNIRTNVRDLEGALLTLDSFRRLVGGELTREKVLDHIKNFIPAQALKESEIGIEQIIEATARFYNINAADIKSRSRNKNISRPRHIAIYITSEMTSRSLSEIGQALSIKDHTSVKYAIDKISDAIKSDEDLNNEIESIKTSILKGPENEF